MPIPSLTHCHSEICFVPTGQGTMQPSDYVRTYQQEMTGLHEMDGLTITKHTVDISKFQVHIITLIFILKKSALNILIIKYHGFLLHLCLAHVIPRISSLRTALQLAEPSMCRHSSWEISTTATLQSSLEAPVASSMVETHSFQICSQKYMYTYDIFCAMRNN